MHITILALGSLGDIQPYASLGRGLVSAGHAIRFITFENFGPLIAANGLDFHPIHGDARSLVANAGANMSSLIRSFSSLAEGYTKDLSGPGLGETDLLINQLPGGVFGKDLAEKHGLKMVLASVIPLTRTRTHPLIGFPTFGLSAYNMATYSIGEQLLWLMFRSRINVWREQILGLPPVSSKEYISRKYPVLNGFSPHVVSRPDDWDEEIHITGYWFPEDRDWTPSAALRDYLNEGKPPVFVGFGSMPVDNPVKTTNIILDALHQSGNRGILLAGWGDLAERSLPDGVYRIDYAPYKWLFPRMAMVIHHGGSGTTGQAIRSGVPSCAIPFVFDQFYWGKRITSLGVGPESIPFKKLSASRLASVIHRATSSELMRVKAAELGTMISQEDGIRMAIEIIESGILFSRSKKSADNSD